MKSRPTIWVPQFLCHSVTVTLSFFLSVTSAVALEANVDLTVDPAARDITAVYHLPAPTDKVLFDEGGEIRKLTWAILTRGGKTSVDGMSIDFDAPVQEFSVRLSPLVRDGAIDRAYSPIVYGSEKNVLVFLSELSLNKTFYETNVRAHSETINVAGKRRQSGEIIWSSSAQRQYAAFGTFAKTELTSGVVFSDPGLPAWIVSNYSEFQRVLNAYQLAFGPPGLDVPWIVIMHTDDRLQGTRVRGDALAGFVRLNLIGSGWKESTPQNRVTLLKLFSHELFHLWNGHHFHLNDDKSIWLLEGGADAASVAVLGRVGLVTKSTTDADAMAKINECTAIAGISFVEKLGASSKSPYTCGAAMFYLVSLNAQAKRFHVDPIEIWKRIFDQASSQMSYSPTTFFNVIAFTKLKENGSIIKDDGFAWDGLIHGNLNRLGLKYSLKAALPTDAYFSLSGQALERLMRADCSEGFGFWREEYTLIVDPNPSCITFNHNMTIVGFGGYRFLDNSGKAYWNVVGKCKLNRRVDIDLNDGQKLPIVCANKLPELPRFVRSAK